MHNKTVSIFSLFKVSNFLMILGLIGVLLNVEGSSYTNEITCCLAIFLSLLNHFLIVDSKKNQNPFLLLLSIWLLLFVELRVISLALTDYSFVLSRFNAKPNQINNSLIVIIISVIFLWIPLHFKCKTVDTKGGLYDINAKANITRSLLFWLITFLVQITVSLEIPVISGLAEILSQYFLNVSLTTLIVGVFCMYYWKEASKNQRLSFVIILLGYISWQTLQGNRSGLFAIMTILIVAAFTLRIYRIKKIYVALVALLAPIMLFLFSFATMLRQFEVGTVGIKNIDVVDIAKNNETELLSAELLNPVFDRIGYLDFSCEMISQRDKLSAFINVSNEIKSIVDNALSPGFDIFDSPKISNTITNYYLHGIILSKKAMVNLDYHSDELTLIGESAVLFGIPLMFIFLFLISYIFKYLWIKSEPDTSKVNKLIKQAIFLFLFNTLLSSYGFDWFVMNIIQFFFAYFIFKHFIIIRTK